jgi:hypothetical protein
MFEPNEATIRQLLLDRSHRTDELRVNIFIFYYSVSSIFKTVRPHFTHVIFLLRRPCCVLLCVVYHSITNIVTVTSNPWLSWLCCIACDIRAYINYNPRTFVRIRTLLVKVKCTVLILCFNWLQGTRSLLASQHWLNWSKNSSSCMETNLTSPCSQEPATGSYSESVKTNPHPHTILFY